MKKTIVILSVAITVLLCGYMYYTHRASKECGIVLTMAMNMESQGVIDHETAKSVYRDIKRSCNMMYPVNTLRRMQRMHATLQRELDEHNAISENNMLHGYKKIECYMVNRLH